MSSAARPTRWGAEGPDRGRLRADLRAAMVGAGSGLSAADRLCHACVELFDVDGAAISVVKQGMTVGTFGSSGELGRRLDDFQFTFGEGPCLDAVAGGRPVLVADLGGPGDRRWPAFTGAVLDAGVHAVFALPTTVASVHVGALDLYRRAAGPLSEDGRAGSLLAAQLAALPLLQLMTADLDWAAIGDGESGWDELASLERVEVYQATGMIMAQLGVGAVEAVARLRASAFARGLTASQVAWQVVERQVSMEADAGGGSQAGGTPGDGRSPR